ncbi:uncharacterized protein LOC126797731 [Argentina anserina]|uniref:uncharacterized protein LOC126797731 n=1 Tax=Argentina anserina TaxID=57926 RepID=UPI00217639B1|nr:uncharacterized protein LOC126797731 [Potentilla anserina]
MESYPDLQCRAMWRNKPDSDVLCPAEEGKIRRVGRSRNSGSSRGNGAGSDEGHAGSDREMYVSEYARYEAEAAMKQSDGQAWLGDVPIISGCDLIEFERVVARISNERLIEIEELGFGPVHIIRGIKLNVELYRMLLSNFDVKNSTIKIHGRNLSITAKDVNRLMGLRFRGREVDINTSTDDEVICMLKRKLCGDESEICMRKLRRMVLSTYNDEEMWKVCFALYAMSTVFCPSLPGYVDDRLLVPLKNAGLIRTHNWALFVFNKLVEGVNAYQSGEPVHVGGCLIFLQVFYLSVLSERMCMFPRMCLPALSWGQNECDRMYRRIEGLGGFYATEGVWVSKRHYKSRSTEYSGSRDYSTGLKTNVVDDMADLKSDMADVQFAVGSLESIMQNVVPEIVELRKVMTTIRGKLCNLRSEEGMTELVSQVRKVVVAKLNGGSSFVCRGRENQFGGSEPPNGGRGDDKVSLNRGIGEVRVMKDTVTSGAERIVVGKKRTICSINDLSPTSRDLMAYLFSRKGRDGDASGSHEIGRFGDFTVCRRDLKCLCPEHCLNSEIINLMGALSFANRPETWFLPTSFSDHAKTVGLNSQVGGQEGTTAGLRSVRPLVGPPNQCRKIFIPICDDVDEHWYLAVFNVYAGECEIWDSCEIFDCNNFRSTQDRREDYAKCAINLIGSLFAEEFVSLPQPSSKTGGYVFTYPTGCPIQRRREDSGIFLIRNMQHYRERWYEGFNAGDQRVRIALEIVNHPLNECAQTVWANVHREQKERAAGDNGFPGTTYVGGGGGGHSIIPPFSKKFKPRVPSRS